MKYKFDTYENLVYQIANTTCGWNEISEENKVLIIKFVTNKNITKDEFFSDVRMEFAKIHRNDI